MVKPNCVPLPLAASLASPDAVTDIGSAVVVEIRDGIDCKPINFVWHYHGREISHRLAGLDHDEANHLC
jgi:hypothetical protein